MKVIKLKVLSRIDLARIIKRSFGTNEEIFPEVRKKITDIKESGDRIILGKYQKRYGKDKYRSIQITSGEIKEAYSKVNKNLIRSLKQMRKNIRLVHEAQLAEKIDQPVFPEKGIAVWRVWRAIEKVGLYIPGGNAIYPSSTLMSVIPAQIAGCKEIVMCSPPKDDGKLPFATIVAADMVGLTKIYKVGGVEAIASMAYGTKTIPKVYKIYGAGNSFVTAAKMLVFGEVAIDMPAGPSEIFIIADDSANPSYIAADLLADGEHGEDSACVLLTTSEKIAQGVAAEIEKQLEKLETKKRSGEALRKYGLLAVVASLSEAISFTNDYAPEHLEIMVKDPEKIVSRIKNAGSVFLGSYTTKSAGDYATGANHILPTGGMAKMYPPLGVDSFGKWMQVQECTKEGLSKIRKTIETIADVEQLPAHRSSVSIRFEERNL